MTISTEAFSTALATVYLAPLVSFVQLPLFPPFTASPFIVLDLAAESAALVGWETDWSGRAKLVKLVSGPPSSFYRFVHPFLSPFPEQRTACLPFPLWWTWGELSPLNLSWKLAHSRPPFLLQPTLPPDRDHAIPHPVQGLYRRLVRFPLSGVPGLLLLHG